MCPLRFVLIFLSAALAAFFALSSFGESSIIDPDESPEDCTTQEKKSIAKVSYTAYLSTLVDMATGRYLWTQYKRTKRA